MSSPLRVIQYGLGPIGQSCVRNLIRHYDGRLQLVGAVDIDPEKIGRDVAEVSGLEREAGVRVSDSLEAALSTGGADVVIHTTSSYLTHVESQLAECLSSGLNVVSSTEELSFPFRNAPAVAAHLDETARRNGVSLLGTGVNPGFIMDTLAVVASSVCVHVDRIRIERVVDAGKRRLPLQRKIGFGMTREEFERKAAEGGFGHVGLPESALMLAAGLGWEVDEVAETIEPELTNDAPARSGPVLGLRQRVEARTTDGQSIELILRMYVGADNPADHIEIVGDPGLTLTVPGGVFGDTATVAMLLNAAPRVAAAPPGLRTMLDLPIANAIHGVAAESTTQMNGNG